MHSPSSSEVSWVAGSVVKRKWSVVEATNEEREEAPAAKRHVFEEAAEMK